jgi:DNA-binding winged helix-turn-helix (wHTH) protein
VADIYRIGDWAFDPSSHELSCDGAVVRLEHRAAKALALLCEQRGEVVSKAELSQRLWGARQVSPNSLSVVIRDLRKALGDDARAPAFIQTVAKGGYRLVAMGQPAPARAVRRPWSMVAASAVVLALLGGAGLAAWARMAAPLPAQVVILEGVPNATGDPAYDTLAKASEGLVVTGLSHRPGLTLWHVDGRAALPDAPPGAVRLSVKLVLWSGQPDLEFVAQRPGSPEVMWSGRAFGAEDTLPHKIVDQVSGFARAVTPKRPAR